MYSKLTFGPNGLEYYIGSEPNGLEYYIGSGPNGLVYYTGSGPNGLGYYIGSEPLGPVFDLCEYVTYFYSIFKVDLWT
jgi:hypothetical protein